MRSPRSQPVWRDRRRRLTVVGLRVVGHHRGRRGGARARVRRKRWRKVPSERNGRNGDAAKERNRRRAGVSAAAAENRLSAPPVGERERRLIAGKLAATGKIPARGHYIIIIIVVETNERTHTRARVHKTRERARAVAEREKTRHWCA